MNIPQLTWLLAIAYVVNCDQFSVPNQQPVMKVMQPKTAHVQKQSPQEGTIDGHNARGQDYALDAKKEDATAKSLGGSKVWESKQTKGSIAATNPRGNHGNINKVGQSDGNYRTDRNQGTLTNSKQGSDQIADLNNNNGRQKLHNDVEGGINPNTGFKKMDTTGTRGNSWDADPKNVDKAGSVGTIDRVSAKKTYNYKVVHGAGDAESAELEDPSNTGLFRGPKKYDCVGNKVGVTTCKDDMGRKVGEARTAVNGDTVVTNSLGVPVATVRASKDAKTGQPTATVDNGLYVAKSSSQQDMNCPGFTNDKVKIRKPLKFKYANQRDAKGATFDWPACTQVIGTLDLAPNIQAKNLAIKFTTMVLPAGRMDCNDPATQACGGNPTDCYYCDMCVASKRGSVYLMNNAQSNVCDAKGGTLVIQTTVCPPPEVNQFKYCDEFQKPLGDPYWKKKGNLDVIMEVFNRPDDAACEALYNDPIKSTAAFSDFKKDPANLKYLLSWKPPKEIFIPWYKYNKAEKVGCRESVVNYDVSGSKVNSGFLFEAITSSGVLQKGKCPTQPGKK